MGDSVNLPDVSVQSDILKIFPKLYSNDPKIRLSSASLLLEKISKNKVNIFKFLLIKLFVWIFVLLIYLNNFLYFFVSSLLF